jgi:tRNA nucleotidyltransferase (CCA-adding enzyme)
MKILFPAWSTTKIDTTGLAALQKTRQQLTDIGVQSDPAAARMYFLTRKMSDKDVSAMQKLLPRHHFVEQWRDIEEDAKSLAKQLLSKEYAAPSATWKLLMSSRPELILFLDVTTRQSAIQQKINAFLTKWPQYRQKMPLLKMTEMRITPDLPIYPKLLEEMFFLMLDGKLKTEAEIVKYLEPHQPPLPVAPPTPPRRGRGKKKAVAKPVAKPAVQSTEQQGDAQPTAPPGTAVAQTQAKAAKSAKKEAPVAKPTTPSVPTSKGVPQAAPAKAAPVKAAPAKPTSKAVPKKPDVKKKPAKTSARPKAPAKKAKQKTTAKKKK